MSKGMEDDLSESEGALQHCCCPVWQAPLDKGYLPAFVSHQRTSSPCFLPCTALVFTRSAGAETASALQMVPGGRVCRARGVGFRTQHGQERVHRPSCLSQPAGALQSCTCMCVLPTAAPGYPACVPQQAHCWHRAHLRLAARQVLQCCTDASRHAPVSSDAAPQRQCTACGPGPNALPEWSSRSARGAGAAGCQAWSAAGTRRLWARLLWQVARRGRCREGTHALYSAFTLRRCLSLN